MAKDKHTGKVMIPIKLAILPSSFFIWTEKGINICPELIYVLLNIDFKYAWFMRSDRTMAPSTYLNIYVVFPLSINYEFGSTIPILDTPLFL